jgi:hypothetical protein
MAMTSVMAPSAYIARSQIVARELEDRLLDAFKKAGWRADLKPALVRCPPNRSPPAEQGREGTAQPATWAGDGRITVT